MIALNIIKKEVLWNQMQTKSKSLIISKTNLVKFHQKRNLEIKVNKVIIRRKYEILVY
jgi:hypothetical protein